ncbi:MAG TPA: Holliday junction branch migration protein RuvA [Actinomycetota bacterium]|nr:Holliday junction branch migration protein RuvA [Actinomycetota bacterium]
MISFLEGILAERRGDRVVVSAGGIGYEVLVSTTTLARLPATGRKTRLLTHLQVRDDAMTLYGFAAPGERDLFLLLVGVTGVGPKVALAILSVLSSDALRRAILDGDADAITIVPGVGKKVAARVVIDLKDKLGGVVELPAAGPVAEVREALAGLGLSPQEIHDALGGLDGADGPVEDLLRRALQRVGARA